MSKIPLHRMMRMRRGTALVGILALLFLLHGPSLTSAAWTNAGMLSLRDGLLAQTARASGTYPFYAVLNETPATARAMENLRRAANLNKNSLAARWALGRAALALGDGEIAAGVLEPLLNKAEVNPLLYLNMLSAASHGGRPEEVLALYEAAPPPQHTQAISNVVALAYLDVATGRQGEGERERQGERETREQGQGDEIGGLLERVVGLRPGDLYATYNLYRLAETAGDADAATTYSETLVYFPLEAVHPTDERLLNYAAEAIPALLEDGLWDRDKTLNVVSFLVWQHNGAAGVERLLEQLSERYPAEPDWSFYLAELYHRRGDLDRAEAAYQQVLAVDPEYAQAYLRLGMVAEERGEQGAGETKSGGT